jgi:hypothetical protein
MSDYCHMIVLALLFSTTLCDFVLFFFFFFAN